MNKLLRVIRYPEKILLYFMQKGYFNWLKDEPYLKLKYKLRMGKKLNLKNPKTFNEKLNWLKLNDRKDIYTTMVDKYKVKKYVSDLIGNQYIIPNLGIYNSFDDIDFSKLPNQFVIKCTHDSGGIVICKDKKNLDIAKARKKINKSLKTNYYYSGREWPYKNVEPRIIVEKYLEDKSDKELRDYKVLCFHGVAKLIEVHVGRFGDHRQDFYDLNWNKTHITQGLTTDIPVSKPKDLKLMIELSEKLASGIKHVRIDWYEVNGQLLFGEITFYDGSGMDKFDIDEYDKEIGDMMGDILN